MYNANHGVDIGMAGEEEKTERGGEGWRGRLLALEKKVCSRQKLIKKVGKAGQAPGQSRGAGMNMLQHKIQKKASSV